MKAKKNLKPKQTIKLEWPPFDAENFYPFKIQISLSDCKHGYLYQLSSRNLRLGVFNKATNGFIGIRLKFGNTFLFTEDHYDTGVPHGTACPLKLLEKCPKRKLIENNTELFNWLKGRYLSYGLSHILEPCELTLPSSPFAKSNRLIE